MPTANSARFVACAALLSSLAVATGCAAPEPSPRSVSFRRAFVVAEPVSPAVAVLQGEGGPIEVTVRNAGTVPVRAFEVLPEGAVDDGAQVESEAKGVWPELAPGETAKATVIVRPTETGDQVVHRFRVTFADARKDELVKAVVGGGDADPSTPPRAHQPLLRRSGFDVTMQVSPATASIEEARSKAKVGSTAPAVFCATLSAWAFEVPDGVVVVPTEGEVARWKGVTLRAVAWIDLLAGDKIQIRFGSDEAHEKVSIAGLEVLDDMDPAHRGEANVDDTKAAILYDYCARNDMTVETLADGPRRLLLVSLVTPAAAPAAPEQKPAAPEQKPAAPEQTPAAPEPK